MRKLLPLFLIAAWCPAFVSGQLFNPVASLNGCYTFNQFQKEITAGIFNLDHRRVNLGFEAANEFALKEHFFVRTGIRFQSFRTTISGLNQIAELHDKPDPFVWTKTFNSLTIPVVFGRNFQAENGRVGKIYLGASVGLFSNSMAKGVFSSAVIRNISTTDTFRLESTDTIGLLKPQWIANLELGGSYQPFKKAPRLFLGMFASCQLNHVPAGYYTGKAENVSQGSTYLYKASFSQRSLHVGLSLQYYFKKRPQPSAPHNTASL